MGSAIIVPTVAKGFASAQRGLGIDSYDLHELYGPDTAVWRSKVLDLGPVKYGPPNKSYWFDRSRYNNHGTITGATWKQEPSGLWVLDFDGTDDYIDCGTGASINITGALTLAAWIKPTANAFYEIISNGLDANYGYRFMILANGGMRFDTTQAPAQQQTLSSTGIIVAGIWQHIAATRSGAVAKLYRNGVDVTNTSGSHIDPVPSLVSVKIGIYTDGLLGDMNGRVGLPKILNVAQTAGQVASTYQQERHLLGV